MNIKSGQQEDNKKTLDLFDLLDDEQADVLSEYLTVSITNDGENTKVTVTTTEEAPTAYSSVFLGVTAHSLQSLIPDSIINPELDI